MQPAEVESTALPLCVITVNHCTGLQHKNQIISRYWDSQGSSSMVTAILAAGVWDGEDGGMRNRPEIERLSRLDLLQMRTVSQITSISVALVFWVQKYS